jgi:hypothetical protein
MRWQWVLRVAGLVFLGITLTLGLTATWTYYKNYNYDPPAALQTGCNTVFERWTGAAGFPVDTSKPAIHDSEVDANIACAAALDRQQEWVIAMGAVALGLFVSSFLVRRRRDTPEALPLPSSAE